MIDRLKIRVWDKVYEHYWKEEEVYLNIQWLLYPDNDNIHNVEIEQCTGLKDKNDKLIYEGDVILVPYVDPIFNASWNNRNTEKALVKLVNGSFVYDYENRLFYLSGVCGKCEVIGNIHINENKELLK